MAHLKECAIAVCVVFLIVGKIIGYKLRQC